MTTVHIHIKIAPDVQARLYTTKGNRDEFVTVRIDDVALNPNEREHLLRMTSSAFPRALDWGVVEYHPISGLYATAYKPDVAYARLLREPYALNERNDSEIIDLILNDAEPLTIARAVIAADCARYEQAQTELERLLNDAVVEFLHSVRARIAQFEKNGPDALTEHEIEWGHRPQKLGWYEAVVERCVLGASLGEDVEYEWKKLNELFDSAREEATRAAEARARVAEARNLAEARAWIAEFGSARLRTLVERNLPFWRDYVEERARAEYPEFVPDIFGKVEWRDLKPTDEPPTDEQIALSEYENAEIVCLTRNIRGYPCGRTCVVIPGAFGGITLVERDEIDDEEDD